MKLSLSSSELLAQLQTATRVASTRSAVQALSGVMISAQPDSQPELLATDMEIGLRVPLNAEVARPGTAVLPARLLLDVARSLSAERLSLRATQRLHGPLIYCTFICFLLYGGVTRTPRTRWRTLCCSSPCCWVGSPGFGGGSNVPSCAAAWQRGWTRRPS